jgi:16S rRNA (guanine527-N7)-methyltransferase
MEKLVHEAQRLFGVHLTGRQVVALMTFERELLAWNEKFNLTAIRDAEGIRTKHFLDSFSCVLAWKENPPRRLVDIGTGAGFPGIPLKILYPSMRLTLVESVGKKANFCRHMVEILKLEATEVMTARAEDVDARLPRNLRLGSGTLRGEPAGAGRIPPAAGTSGRGHAGTERPEWTCGNPQS